MPSKLSVYSTSPATATGDNTRSDFLFSQLTSQTFSYSPSTGLGSAAQPFKGTVSSYLQNFISPAGQCLDARDAIAAGAERRRFDAAAEIQFDLGGQYRHRDGELDPGAEHLRGQLLTS